MKKFDKYKQCEGCLYYDENCGTIPQIDNSVCPCVSCLVKMVCTHTCDEWLNYTQEHRDIEYKKVMTQ